MSDLKETFEKAAEVAKLYIGSLPQPKILNLYGLFKQASEGDINISKPNFWNVTAKQKWEAWSQQKGKSIEDAMAEYIAIINEVNPNWMADVGSMNTSWVRHSTMQNDEIEVSESDKDLFYWVKENNTNKLNIALQTGVDVNIADEEGLGLCHWAADRGHVDTMRLLLSSGANADLRDADGQTALHYAACCGHADVVRLLLQHGADPAVADFEGNTPADVAESDTLHILNGAMR